MIAIRSDYLYLLDELSANIPAILPDPFSSPGMDRDKMHSGRVSLPAGLTGNFASPPFPVFGTGRGQYHPNLRAGRKRSTPFGFDFR